MGVHVYCIVPAGLLPPAGLTGLGDEPVRAATAETVTVWLSTLAARPAPDTTLARTHNDVVRAAMNDHVTPVPVRFGQWFDSERDAVSHVAAGVALWLDRLAHFAGRAEYGVRVLDDAPVPARDVRTPPAGSGRAYMHALAQRQALAAARREHAGRIAMDAERHAAELVADVRTDTATAAPTLLTIAHLVAWRDAEAYHSRMQELRAEHTDLRFLLSGPWPPYSFVA